MRRNDGEAVWREQTKYSKMTCLSNFNDALAKIVPVATLPGSAKLPYGQN